MVKTKQTKKKQPVGKSPHQMTQRGPEGKEKWRIWHETKRMWLRGKESHLERPLQTTPREGSLESQDWIGGPGRAGSTVAPES